MFTWVVDNDIECDLKIFILICSSSWVQRNQLIFHAIYQIPDDVLARADRKMEIFMINHYNLIRNSIRQARLLS